MNIGEINITRFLRVDSKWVSEEWIPMRRFELEDKEAAEAELDLYLKSLASPAMDYRLVEIVETVRLLKQGSTKVGE